MQIINTQNFIHLTAYKTVTQIDKRKARNIKVNYLTPASPTIPMAIPAESPARPQARPEER